MEESSKIVQNIDNNKRLSDFLEKNFFVKMLGIFKFFAGDDRFFSSVSMIQKESRWEDKER